MRKHNPLVFVVAAFFSLFSLASSSVFANSSGVCIAHMFYNRMKHIDVEAISSCFDTLLHIIAMIAYKALSITVPYIVVLLILQMVMKYFYDFGIIDIPSMDHLTCETNMWHNIAFIDQFSPLDERVSRLKMPLNRH